ncbi:MAG TPA: ABC transporter permease [Candidatus Acidoferrales bacterium]|nr:ABC transporter permease [Candidatus Acidoferrales bacterium]
MFSDLMIRLRSLFRRASVEREMNDELRFHVERQTEKLAASGMNREEAARRARIELGGLEQVKEECREARGVSLLESLLQDVRYALRMLRKNPGFTAVSVLTLALGIGANAAIFSLMDAVLLSRLPVKHPEELVLITSWDAKARVNSSFSYPMYQNLRDRNSVFAGVIARGGGQFNLNYRGVSERVRGELVSGNYYEVLGVRPWVGQLFTQQDDITPSGHPIVVLSYGFWQRRFGGDPGVVGQTILLNEHPMTVIGVSPPEFYGTGLDAPQDVRVPLMMTPVFKPVPENRMQSRRHQWLDLMARRKPGVSLAEAQTSLEVLYHQIREGEEQQLPANTSAFDRQQFLANRIRLESGAQGRLSLQREMSQPLLLLFAVTGIVLLILCANLANLSLARTAARGQEVAVRLALGAGRGRLVRQWLTESVVLSLLGALASVLVAIWGKAALLSFVPAEFRVSLVSPLGWRVFAFLLVVAIATGVLLGLAPALRAARSSSADTLRSDSRMSATGSGVLSVRGGLTLMQVALSLPLLVGAGLFLQSLRNLEGMDAGFQKENILLASMNPALNGYPQERIHTLYVDLLAQLRAQPGVRSASLSTNSPISGGWDQLSVVVEGYQPRQGEEMSPNWAAVSPGYFKTLGIPMLAGRDFTDQDTAGAPKAAIINETMAHYFFKDANPIGRKIGLDNVPDTEIVGLVKDSKYSNLREDGVRHMYMPTMQQERLYDLTLAVRTSGDPRAAVDLVRATTSRVDPHLPLYGVTTLEAQIDVSLTAERMIAWLSILFGMLATLLSAIGLYGVVAFSAERRTREIGIRIALGALPGDVLDLVLRQMGYIVAVGLTLGAAAALVVSRVVGSMLYGVRPMEPVVYLLAGFVLAASAALAAYLPARRATRVDPVVALRHE